MMERRNKEFTQPGKILREHFMEPMGLNVTNMANLIGSQRSSMSKIIHGKRRFSAEMSERLSKVLNTEPDFWFKLQKNFDGKSFAFTNRSVKGHSQRAVIKKEKVILINYVVWNPVYKISFPLSDFEKIEHKTLANVRDFVSIVYGDRLYILSRAYSNFGKILTAQANAVLGVYKIYRGEK